MNIKVCPTIVDAYNYLVTQCYYGRSYEQHSTCGSFANEENTWRIQLPPLLLRIDQPTNFIYLPKNVTSGMIRDYCDTYLMGGTKHENHTYTYWERIEEQICEVFEMLRKTPDTNQAAISISQPSDIKLSDPPCLRQLVFSYFNNRLHITSFWRSNDIGEAFLLNQGGVGLFLEEACEYAGLKVGYHYYCSTGSHLYMRK